MWHVTLLAMKALCICTKLTQIYIGNGNDYKKLNNEWMQNAMNSVVEPAVSTDKQTNWSSLEIPTEAELCWATLTMTRVQTLDCKQPLGTKNNVRLLRESALGTMFSTAGEWHQSTDIEKAPKLVTQQGIPGRLAVDDADHCLLSLWKQTPLRAFIAGSVTCHIISLLVSVMLCSSVSVGLWPLHKWNGYSRLLSTGDQVLAIGLSNPWQRLPITATVDFSFSIGMLWEVCFFDFCVPESHCSWPVNLRPFSSLIHVRHLGELWFCSIHDRHPKCRKLFVKEPPFIRTFRRLYSQTSVQNVAAVPT